MILFAGDPHGSYDHIYPFIKEQENVALIILGDLQLTTADELDKLAQHCDIWFIHGNHDSKTISAFNAIWGSKWQSRNLHNRVVDIQGTRIAGLGGVFRGQIWMPPNRPMFLILFIIANIAHRRRFGEAVCLCVTARQFFHPILKS